METLYTNMIPITIPNARHSSLSITLMLLFPSSFPCNAINISYNYITYFLRMNR